MGEKKARGLTDAEVESGCVQVGHLLHLEYGYLDEKLREMMRCCYRAGFAKLGRLELIESALDAPDELGENRGSADGIGGNGETTLPASPTDKGGVVCPPPRSKPLLSDEEILQNAEDLFGEPHDEAIISKINWDAGARWARDESVKCFLALLPTDAELELRYSGYVIKMVREDAIREAKFTRDEIKTRLEAGK